MAESWGGAREGAGRKKKSEGTRGQHQIRAYPDEWEIIQRIARMVKHGDRRACEEFLARMEKTTE